jgi:hypothetical protein
MSLMEVVLPMSESNPTLNFVGKFPKDYLSSLNFVGSFPKSSRITILFCHKVHSSHPHYMKHLYKKVGKYGVCCFHRKGVGNRLLNLHRVSV